MYLIGEKWFDGSLQAIFYNFGVIIWIISELAIFALTADKKENKTKTFDQLSVYAVMAGNIFSCTLAIIGMKYLHTAISGVFAWIGIIILYAGVFFRCYAVWTLKKFFTVTVKMKNQYSW